MQYFGKAQRAPDAAERDAVIAEEIEFIQARDSFYLSTVSESDWPYVQHRGGPRGFLRVIRPAALAFADYKGNRPLLSIGNLAVNDRVTLFLMDYPQRTRLKILGYARVEDARQHRADQRTVICRFRETSFRGVGSIWYVLPPSHSNPVHRTLSCAERARRRP